MHVFSRPKFRQFAADYPDAATSLNAWFKIAEKAGWDNIHEVGAIILMLTRLAPALCSTSAGTSIA